MVCISCWSQQTGCSLNKHLDLVSALMVSCRVKKIMNNLGHFCTRKNDLGIHSPDFFVKI